MSKIIFALAVALIALSTSPARAEIDESAIKQSVQTFVQNWNKHDAKAMAENWTDQGDLINPAGRVAKVKTEIEKLLTDEHTSVMKNTTANMEVKNVSPLGENLALVDIDMNIKGMTNPDGKAVPTMPLHVAVVMKKEGTTWKYANARPYAFVKPAPGHAKHGAKAANK